MTSYDDWKTRSDRDAYPDLDEQDICCEGCELGLTCERGLIRPDPIPTVRLTPADFGLSTEEPTDDDGVPF